MSILPEELFKTKKGLESREIAEYLTEHPEFFVEHEHLLAKMVIPHSQGSAISLVERQVQVMREENQQLQRKIQRMIEAARRNEEVNEQIQRLIIALLETSSIEDLFDTLYLTLQQEFDTDRVSLRVFDMPLQTASPRPESVEYDAEVFSLFETVLKSRSPICGRITAAQIEYLFGQEKIGSAVLIPLGSPEAQGILALGSQDVARFHAGMSTDLLSYMGKLVTHILYRWQALNASV